MRGWRRRRVACQARPHTPVVAADSTQKYLAYKAENLEEHYTDLHMLRVTKELQTLIKGGDSGEASKNLDKAEAQIEYKKGAHDARCKKLRQSLAKLKRQVKGKLDENARLRSQAGELNTNVSVRQSIQASSACLQIEHQPTEAVLRRKSAQGQNF